MLYLFHKNLKKKSSVLCVGAVGDGNALGRSHVCQLFVPANSQLTLNLPISSFIYVIILSWVRKLRDLFQEKLKQKLKNEEILKKGDEAKECQK